MLIRCLRKRCAGSLVLGTLFGVAVGCGGQISNMPPTFSATGSVHYKGGTPVAGGAILFIPLTDNTLSVSGEINDDGSFTLYTVKGSEKTKGAPEGAYRVTVQPPILADHRPVQGISLTETYRIEPKENTFTIEVTAPGKKP
jgi:hypothetical protein